MSTNSDTFSAQSIKTGQEDEDASYQGDSEENRSRNNRSRTDATQRNQYPETPKLVPDMR